MKKMYLFLLIGGLFLLGGNDLLAHPFAGGDGSSDNPWQIATAAQLDAIRGEYLDDYFIQTANIVLTSFNWDPIGNDTEADPSGVPFTGNYDGAEFSISGLTISRSGESEVGLFGCIGKGTAADPVVIRNVELVSVGDVTGARGTGSLVGRVRGNVYTLIENCSTSGSGTVSGNGATGGLVGANNSARETPGGTDNPSLSQCWANIAVLAVAGGNGDKIGGLVGCNQKGNTINCYARGSVTVPATGTYERIGGLAGCTDYRGTITNSFSTGLVTEGVATRYGGLVGYLGKGGSRGVVTDSYWDKTTSEQDESSGGTGYTTTQMKVQGNFTGFDFTNVWTIGGTTNNGYPYLLNTGVTTYNYWTGDNNTSTWTTIGNWSANRVPIATDIAVIPTGLTYYPIITSTEDITATAKILDILTTNPSSASDGKITINLLGKFTVVGDLRSETTGILIKSNATGTGSLIQDAERVYATVERYIAGWTSASTGWHLLSSPVAEQFFSSGAWITSGTGNDYDIYMLDETEVEDEYWLNQKYAANNMTEFVTGTGYLVAYEQTATKEFVGALNTTNVTISGLTNTGDSDKSGWHLVGNPFSSAINWTTGSWVKTDIDAVAQVWDAAAASYKTTTDKSNIIPSMNGFMVHTSVNGGVLTIPTDARLHNTNIWYKANEEEFILLKANDLENSTSQSSIVRFNPLATDDYDGAFDSYFLAGFAPLFYSTTNAVSYSLNTLPEVTNTLTVPFSFVKNASSQYNITLAQSIPEVEIYLTDYKTNTVHNLTLNPVYTFTSSEGDDIERFEIKFSSTGIDESEQEFENIQIWSSNSIININNIDNQVGDIRVVNMFGQSVYTSALNRSENQQITLNMPTGYYIVTVVTKSGVVNKKVYL